MPVVQVHRKQTIPDLEEDEMGSFSDSLLDDE